MSEGPLQGILVVSLEQAVAAPLCSRNLADAGARVIKIERPEGDFARGYDALANGQSSYFVWLNRGKQSLVLDLTRPGDKALLEKTMIVYGSPMADGNIHNHRRCPLIVLGGANGKLRGNLHLKAPDGTPMANAMLSLMHSLGLEDRKSFGDSTGEFTLS